MIWKHRVVLALVAMALEHMAVPAQAATITVTANAPDELGANGSCSLREAIDNINVGGDFYEDCPGTGGYGTNDTIVVPAGTYTSALEGAGEENNVVGDYDIRADLAITGAGASTTEINGGGLDRVFHVTGAFTVQFTNVTISGGHELGGGIYNGGGTVAISGSDISGNSGSVSNGGGIYNTSAGVMTITASNISDNSAENGAGAIYNTGGAVLSITDSTLSGNTAWGHGGAINNYQGTLVVTNTTFSGNTSTIYGGAICNWEGEATITHATLGFNVANQDGDAIFVYGGGVTLADTIITSPDGNPDCSLVAGGVLTSAGHNLDTDGSCLTAGGTDIPSGTANLARGRTTAGRPRPTPCSPARTPSMQAIALAAR